MRQGLERAEFLIGAGLLGAITALVFLAAIMRFAGSPVIWSVDLAKLLFIWLCFVGANRALRQRAHLGVDFVIRKFGLTTRLWVETVLAVIFVAFLITLTVKGYELSMLNRERVFGDSGLSYAWVTMAVPVGAVMLSLSIVVNLVEAWRDRAQLIFTRTPETTGTRDHTPAGMG